MNQPLSFPQPLFVKVIDRNNPAITTFVNAAHIVKIAINGATASSGTLYLVDGKEVELGANEADWILRLMSFHAHEQMKIVSEMKRLGGDKS